jgi:methionine-rich copper-binding protein CopC
MASKLLTGPFATILACMATAALADARLVQSTPAPDTTVAAPRSVKLDFSEKITAPGVQLSMGDGMKIPTSASVSSDGKTVSARPTSPFMPGKWTLSWYATSAGGQKIEGSYSFTIK